MVQPEIMKAQDLYDWRAETSEISGVDLHALFSYILNGEPSPRGHVAIDMEAIQSIARGDVGTSPRYGGSATTAAIAVAAHFDQ